MESKTQGRQQVLREPPIWNPNARITRIDKLVIKVVIGDYDKVGHLTTTDENIN
jgi:hypothetical protein